MFQLKRAFVNLKKQQDEAWLFVLDIFMVILAMIYLIWTLLDLLVRTKVVALFIADYGNEAVQYGYDLYTHLDTIFYDTVFVSIFLGELLLRWGIAIYRKTYHRWFFYPFIHWYDTLGCIPIASFKFFRMIRIFSIIYRLHKLRIVDFSETYVYKKGTKYLNVLVEEVSDRVVVNVISGVQQEVDKGNPVTDRILEEVIMPRKTELINFISHRIQKATTSAHISYQADIKEYIDGLIEQAVDDNKEINQIEMIPILGGNISGMLESAISDIVFKVVNQALRDLGSDKNKELLGEIADLAFETVLLEEEDVTLNQIAKNIAHESLDIVKEQVKVKQWKVKEIDDLKS
jgi:phosphoribosyl-ATP pyrophosphohydrolase